MPSHAAVDGHPLHAMLVAAPIALYMVALLLDALYYLRDRDPFWARCSFVVILLGLVGNLVAAVPGFIDYRTIAMPPLSTRHLIVGLTLAVLFLVQLIIRRPRVSGDPPRVFLLLTLIGVMLVGYQGWLGGELVYRYHIGMIPTEEAPPETPGAQAGHGGAARNNAPAPALPAAQLQLAKQTFSQKCQGCHKINGAGGDVGPNLSREGTLHDAAWIEAQIKDPNSHKSGSAMPAFADIPDNARQATAAYLASLR
jgi:uncharacterized membrane protein